ncbi:MAG: hypothetical protein MUF81_10160 [Verrucomicrobia bacterium]|jgi:hypothetical protein|nr:hypothetical protein [Verrucomicrobiota bacterium]
MHTLSKTALPLCLIVLTGLLPAATAAEPTQATPTRIVSEKIAFLSADPAGKGNTSIADILPRSIPGVTTKSISLVGPTTWTQSQGSDENFILLFLDGQGTLLANQNAYEIDGETIARAPLGWNLQVLVNAGKVLNLLCIRKEISADDKLEIAKYPANNAAPWVRRYRECIPYHEAIKSAKTTSRTLLPKNYVPRVALGTVQTTGPDKVGLHEHPMLEQLFLGLRGNDITVHANEANAPLGEFQLLVIPHASMHGASVAEGKSLHYVWMDFFNDTSGQAWLDNHKDIAPGQKY